MSDRDQKLEELKKSLYLLYEFEKPSNFPVKYCSSLNLYNNPSYEQQDDFLGCLVKNSPKPLLPEKMRMFHFQKDMIQKTENDTYIYLPEKQIFQTYFQCVLSISQHYSLESIFKTFSWQEFELFVTSALNHYGYHAFRTFRYSIKEIRHEVDIIARDNHNIFFIDAKRWNSKTINMSALKKCAVNQKIRAEHLIMDRDNFDNLLYKLHFNLGSNSKFHSFLIFPIILVSNKTQYFYIEDGVPILSFSQFNDFLTNFSQIKSKLNPIEIKDIGLKKKKILAI